MGTHNRMEMAQLAETGRKWTSDEARKVLTTWHASGLSLGRFAREHGLTEQRLSWWRRRLERREKGPAEGGPEAFERAGLVPVVVSAGSRANDAVVSIEVGGRISIVVSTPSAVEPRWLAKLVSELEQSCC